ncbi:MAG: hypothetical protein ACTTH5_07905 [Wolinella sp.]
MPQEILRDSLDIHLFFAYFMAIPPFLALYFLYTERRFIKLAKKIKLIAPAYYFLISVALFSGIILATMFRQISPKTLGMFLALLGIFLLELKRHKLQKPITSSEHEAQARFITWAKRKYILDLFLLAFAFWLGM